MDQIAPPALPARPFRLAMLAPTLVVDGVLPIALFKGLEALGVSSIWALAAGCVPPTLNNVRAWATSRRLDPVGILIVGSMASGAAGSLVSGDIATRIVTDCLLNCGWGLAFLGSLFFTRPAMFFLMRSLVTGSDAARTAIWNGLWRYDTFRSALRRITAIWGVVYFAEVMIELTVARATTAERVLTIAPIMNLAGTLGLIVFTRLAMKATRAKLERREKLEWPL